MNTNKIELRDLLNKLANEEIETAPEQSSQVAQTILSRNLLDDLENYALEYNTDLGDTKEEMLTECVLDYSCVGAMITINVEDPSVPSGEITFYGMTKEDSYRIMSEFLSDHEYMRNLVDGKTLKFNRDKNEYLIKLQGSTIHLLEKNDH